MISTWLTEKKIQIVDSVSDWKQAITISAQPLLVDESINENYVEAIFRSHEELGPYYVLAPRSGNASRTPGAGS
ncbi:PTS IIA-like nitrogen-regulatory protein PtsN [Klebsiella michiganensis]|uniref:PTS IIA-like nitrogen-regulatory protein PtsN n=1 Tax=Klebsiella michiganensis TaxID=1134687 RepID=A0A7H4LV04_9ENTR|nr:PTS IIA-like nitrogen-regulatory protein PtsN [Klebsiella michiganensis]